jgi:hypothetical protein
LDKEDDATRAKHTSKKTELSLLRCTQELNHPKQLDSAAVAIGSPNSFL